jgi:hypothetical protein
MYYDKPSESEIHKEAKNLIKSLLNKKTKMQFYRHCSSCYNINNIMFDYEENDVAVVEHKFYYNESNRSADVALVNNNNIKFIFEICHKNKTKECNRPEPWVEVNATEFIKKINENNGYNLECIREYTCDECNEKITIEKNKKILEEELQKNCSCKIQKKYLCSCLESDFELCKLSNKYYCKKCNLWKCRCDNIVNDNNEQNENNETDEIDESESDDEGRLFNYKVDYYSKGKCYGCGKNTHHFKDCHLKNIPKCDKCNNYGHRSIKCIKDTYSNTTCYKCKKFGHMGKNCLYYKFFNGCYKCGKADHLTKKCSNKTENINDKNKYPKQNLINNVDFVD